MSLIPVSTPDPAALPLIDREAELGWLAGLAAQVQSTTSGRLVVILGARGVGKTRIVGAFADWCDSESMVALTAQCVGRAAEPLLPIRDALRQVLGTNQGSVKAALRHNAPDLLEGVPLIGKFLAGLGRELTDGPMVGEDNPRSLYDMLSSLIVALGQDSGVCLIIEDAHMADPDTLSFLTYLINKSRNHRTLMIVTLPAEERLNPSIAEYLAEWEERGNETLTVGPFEREAVNDYLATALSDERIDEPVLERMVAYTGGNPLLLSESVRLIFQGTTSTGLAASVTDVPNRIRQLLDRRLRRLDETTRSFVDAAAVVCETSHELAPMLELLATDDVTALTSLDRSCEAGVLTEDADGNISFTSELFHMVARAQLRPNQRRVLHLNAGTWFEAQHRYSEAAHHYGQAHDRARLLPTALRAAEIAEEHGFYETAVRWYRQVQDLANPADLFPRLARALMVIGDWADAERLVSALPAHDPQALLLRSRLCFARGDVAGAAEHASQALAGGAAEEVGLLLHLANVHLYAGDFMPATEYAERALLAARAGGSINDQARCLISRGACHLYSGDPPAARKSFDDGLRLLDASPPDRKDVGVHSALLGNLAHIEELRQQWEDAERMHRESLRLRRESGDAVGVLEGTLAIGRTALGQGDLDRARRELTTALHMAEDLGEELQQAKTIHALSEVAAHTGDIEDARQLAENARRRFERCGTPYDVAFANLSLASMLAGSKPRRSVEHLAEARSAVERKSFALLQIQFPELNPPLGQRIHAGLLAYAAGDAYGLPWEGAHPDEVREGDPDLLPKAEVWPPGSTSDDTALTLLVAEHLAAAGGLGEPLEFLRSLAIQSKPIPGLGPSTRRAIETYKATGTADNSGSNTNGAPMRALPVGWALPISAEVQRREWTLALTRMTHTGPDALTAACVVAACASWAVESATPQIMLDIALAEAAHVGPSTKVTTAVAALRDGQWEPPRDGITLAPDETVAAVLLCCLEADGDLAQALRLAVGLGGDADTVAALVGGLLGCRLSPTEIPAKLTWLNRVNLPSIDDLSRLAGALAKIRLSVDV